MTHVTPIFEMPSEPSRKKASLPHLAYVGISNPYFKQKNLGQILVRAAKTAVTVGAEVSIGVCVGSHGEGFCIYEDMEPKLLGISHREIHSVLPESFKAALWETQKDMELVSIGALKYLELQDELETLQVLESYKLNLDLLHCLSF